MNHEYYHCLDYDIETCPESCFRARLTRDYKERLLEFADIPVSWAHLKNTAECKITGGNPCSSCIRRDWCKMDSKAVVSCAQYEPTSETHTQHKPKTHADEVRAMNDEELANFLCDTSGTCAGCIAADFCKYGKIGFVEWLKQEVPE